MKNITTASSNGHATKNKMKFCNWGTSWYKDINLTESLQKRKSYLFSFFAEIFPYLEKLFLDFECLLVPYPSTDELFKGVTQNSKGK